MQRTNQDHRHNSGNNESRTIQLKSGSIGFDSSEEEVSKAPHMNSNWDDINQNISELPVNNNIDNMNEKFTEVNDLTKSISRLSINKNSDLGVLTFTYILLPSKN